MFESVFYLQGKYIVCPDFVPVISMMTKKFIGILISSLQSWRVVCVMMQVPTGHVGVTCV